jgi:hypothetical protein
VLSGSGAACCCIASPPPTNALHGLHGPTCNFRPFGSGSRTSLARMPYKCPPGTRTKRGRVRVRNPMFRGTRAAPFLGDDMRPPGASTLVRHAPRFATCARGLYPPKTRLPRCRDCLHPLPKAVRLVQTKFLFQRAIYCGHAICISAVMFQPPYQPAPSAEPTPTFASDAEIELAARLRQQLEARYLQPSAGPPANPSVDVH